MADADRAWLSVRGPHESAVRADIERAVGSLDVKPGADAVDIELRGLTAQAFQFQIRIKRSGAAFERSGVSTADALAERVTSTVLLGLLAREPDGRPRVALHVDADRKLPPAALALWRQTLEQRGFTVLPDAETALARASIKGNPDDADATLAKLLGVRVVKLQLRSRGKEVAVQTAIVDQAPLRGSFAIVPAAVADEEVALMLEVAPLVARWRK